MAVPVTRPAIAACTSINTARWILLYLFNPVVTSPRGLQQASELGEVQKKRGCPRTSLGSFSAAATVFDPERLKEIITELGEVAAPRALRSPRVP